MAAVGQAHPADGSGQVMLGLASDGKLYPISVPIGGGTPGTFKKLTAAATTNITSVKATPGLLTGGFAMNMTTAPKYLKFYNKATAPLLASDVPVLTIPLPGSGVAGNAQLIALGDILGPYGAYFSLGMQLAITGAIGDTDTTVLAAGDVVLGLIYA